MDKNTNAPTSGMSEIRELTDDELDAVSGGSVNSLSLHCISGKHFDKVTLAVR